MTGRKAPGPDWYIANRFIVDKIIGNFVTYILLITCFTGSHLNDCITDVFLHDKKQVFIKGGSLKEKVFNFIKWLRGMRAGPIETRVLRGYDIILVQSDEDRRSLSRVSAGKLDSKVAVLSNGVAPELL